jgi:membrane carboxypeptidase/penicillin-binding protein PbpC
MEVLIYQWSKDFKAEDIDWQVNVIKSRRQFWSTLKPFLYLLALNSSANPDDLIIDIKSEYDSFKKWKIYISENYSLREYGIIRLKKALWNSLNNATVRLAKEIWLQKVWQFYKEYWFKLDFDAEYYGYSLVLWNPDITLENLVLSYINLLPNYKINNNRKLNFYYLESLKKRDNLQSSKINLEWQFTNFKKREINSNKFLLYNILRDPDNRDISFGVNSILNTSVYQAVKTGTSSDFRDNLIVSYNPDFIIWIWIWNNDNSSMVWVTGITWAGYIWHSIIEEAINLWYINENNYDIPKIIEESDYCLDEKCFRKEIIYKKKEKKYYSRIIDSIYDKRDLFENLSDYEREKLEEMWIELR